MEEKSNLDLFNEFLINVANTNAGIRRKVLAIWQVADAARKGYKLEEKNSMKEQINSANKFIKMYYENKIKYYSEEMEKVKENPISIDTAKKIIMGDTQ